MNQCGFNNCQITSEHILFVINKYFDRNILSAVMLTGSYATGKKNLNSDIDVVLLSRLSNRQTTITIQDSGLEYQFIVIPINKLSQILCDDMLQGKFVFFSIFKQGVIIFDKNSILSKLARQYCQIKPRILEKPLGRTIISIIENCRYVEENGINALTAAMSVITNLQMLIIGELSPSAKHIDMKMIDYPDERTLLYNAFTDFIKNKNAKAFTHTAYNLIKHFGIPTAEIKTSTSFLIKPSNKESIIVFVKNAKLFDEITKDLCNALYVQVNEIAIFSFYIGQCQMMDSGTYICVTSKKNNINKSQNEIYRILKNENYSSNVIISPYNTFFFDINLFGEFRNNVYSFLCEIFKFRIQKEFESKEGCILIAYLLMIELYNNIKIFWDNFIIDAMNFYLPEIVDYNDSIDQAHLVKMMVTQNNTFRKSYSTNKQSIYNCIIESKSRKGVFELFQMYNGLISTIFKSESTSFNSVTLIYPNNGITLNTIDIILSSLGLEPHEKYAIVFNSCNLIKDYEFI